MALTQYIHSQKRTKAGSQIYHSCKIQDCTFQGKLDKTEHNGCTLDYHDKDLMYRFIRNRFKHNQNCGTTDKLMKQSGRCNVIGCDQSLLWDTKAVHIKFYVQLN